MILAERKRLVFPEEASGLYFYFDGEFLLFYGARFGWVCLSVPSLQGVSLKGTFRQDSVKCCWTSYCEGVGPKQDDSLNVSHLQAELKLMSKQKQNYCAAQFLMKKYSKMQF